MTAYITTLESDLHDTDRAITLTSAEQAEELALFWRDASHAERVRWWRDASDDERDVLREALDAKAGWVAITATVETAISLAGQKHLAA